MTAGASAVPCPSRDGPSSHRRKPHEHPDQFDELGATDPLSTDDEFVARHIGPSPSQVEHMLATIGVASLDELIDQAVPGFDPRFAGPLELPGPVSERDVIAELRQLAGKNRVLTSLIGMGYTNTIMPPVIARNVFENPAWYTAYTPYQPEISQGRLEALLNFQTMVAELTGLDIANASLLDEATAAAEAMTMARRLARGAGDRFFVHHDTHPQTIAVLATRAEPVGIELVVGDVDTLAEGPWFGALFSYPTSTGAVTDWSAAIETVHAAGGLAIVATDLLACVLATPPGAARRRHRGRLGATLRGADGRSAGPHAGFIAAHAERGHGRSPAVWSGSAPTPRAGPALRLALQTREQHIRREKATSNICTAQVLLANIAGLYAAWHGPDGLERIADRVSTA